MSVVIQGYRSPNKIITQGYGPQPPSGGLILPVPDPRLSRVLAFGNPPLTTSSLDVPAPSLSKAGYF